MFSKLVVWPAQAPSSEMSNKDAIVTLKVLIESSGAAKAMRFGLDMSVGEVVKEIREKTGQLSCPLSLFSSRRRW